MKDQRKNELKVEKNELKVAVGAQQRLSGCQGSLGFLQITIHFDIGGRGDQRDSLEGRIQDSPALQTPQVTSELYSVRATVDIRIHRLYPLTLQIWCRGEGTSWNIRRHHEAN